MKKVTYAFGETPKEESKGIEFTHFCHDQFGWIAVGNKHPLDKIGDISYLGFDRFLGDVFAANDEKYVRIYKGHLNNGTWK